MVRAFALVALLVVARPVAATQVIEVPALAADGRAVSCVPDAPGCDADGSAQNAPATPGSDNGPGLGSLIAGLAGLAVLAMVFGRRKSALPEVVS